MNLPILMNSVRKKLKVYLANYSDDFASPPAITMLTMIAGGVYLGFAFETYRRLTRGLRKNWLFLYVLELGFWFIQTAVLFYILFKVNEGELRIYVFLACL